jgi:hypothetical protein
MQQWDRERYLVMDTKLETKKKMQFQPSLLTENTESLIQKQKLT